MVTCAAAADTAASVVAVVEASFDWAAASWTCAEFTAAWSCCCLAGETPACCWASVVWSAARWACVRAQLGLKGGGVLGGEHLAGFHDLAHMDGDRGDGAGRGHVELGRGCRLDHARCRERIGQQDVVDGQSEEDHGGDHDGSDQRPPHPAQSASMPGGEALVLIGIARVDGADRYESSAGRSARRGEVGPGRPPLR